MEINSVRKLSHEGTRALLRMISQEHLAQFPVQYLEKFGLAIEQPDWPILANY